MSKVARLLSLALLVFAGTTIIVLDVGKVSGRQTSSTGIGAVTAPAPHRLDCASQCQVQWESCSAGAAGDPDIQAICDTQKALCVSQCPTGAPTTTQIKLDKPDPSQPGQSVTVHVFVVGADHPTGTVEITGADVNCTITLNPAAIGHCTVVFNSPGTYTLTATYSGDATHTSSSDTDTHTVQ